MTITAAATRRRVRLTACGALRKPSPILLLQLPIEQPLVVLLLLLLLLLLSDAAMVVLLLLLFLLLLLIQLLSILLVPLELLLVPPLILTFIHLQVPHLLQLLPPPFA
jgi:hypothetical protein